MFDRLRAKVFSHLYRSKRAKMIQSVYRMQDEHDKPYDFEAVVDAGREKLKSLPDWAVSFPIPEGIEARVHDVTFPSPVVVGAFESDFDVLEVYLKLGAGSVITKSAMKEFRSGNKRPRWQQVDVDGVEHSLNAIGLPGPSIDAFISGLVTSNLWQYDRPIGVSIGGTNPDEYFDNFTKVYDALKPLNKTWYAEVNISCPNTPEGQDMGKNLKLLDDLLLDMRNVDRDVLIGVKLSPDMSDNDLRKAVSLVKLYRPTYVNLENTQYRSCEEVGLPKDAISIGGGGFSGPSLFPRTLEMLSLAFEEGVPMMATGGVTTVNDIRLAQSKGALLVGAVTAIGKDVYNIPKWNYELAK